MQDETLKNKRALPSTRQAYHAHIRTKWLVLTATGLAVFALGIVSLMVGSTNLTPGQVLSALFGINTGDQYSAIVVWNLRMPRILTALVGGIALALAGCTFQSVLRNPLASASTLGISAGAAFGASIAIILLTPTAVVAYEGVTFGNSYLTALCAFAGAMASTLAVLALSRFRDMTPECIVLAGVALSALFSGCTALVQFFAEDSQVSAVVFWTFGDLGRAGYTELAIISGVTALSALYFFLNRWNYNAMESGEGSAHSLGVNVKSVRLGGMLVGTACASVVIAFCGTINFIGLIAPHIMRRLIGGDYRFLLPASALAGAGLLLAGDILARVLLPGVILPISAITSFVGAPLFLYLLMKGKRP